LPPDRSAAAAEGTGKMGIYVQLAILGLGSSAAYALLASGLVLIYRASGVLNFAQGAMAMAGAYIFYETHLQSNWPYLAALLFSILVMAIFGALVYLLIMRPLRTAAVLVRIIATLAVLVVIQAIATLHYQATVLSIPEELPDNVVKWGVKFPIDRLWLIGIAAVLMIVLYLFANHTRFGLATRGVAENQRTAASVGWSPDLVGMVNWAIGSGLAALAGVLIVPIATLSPTSLTWTVVPALAVCLVGRFESFPLAFLGALVIGMGQGLLTKWQGPVPGISDLLPLAVILVTLLVRSQAIPQRGEVLHRLPSLGSGRYYLPVVVACLAAGIVGSLYLPEDWVVALGISVVAAIIMLSLVVVTGYAGQLSLGQYALAGLGALITAQLVTNLHWSFAPALVIGVLGAAASGLIFGTPSLRSRGAALAIVTLALGVAIQSVVFQNNNLAGGQFGFSINSLSFLGISLNPVLDPRSYTIFSLCWFAVAALAVSNLRRSRAGRRLIAIRANERAATSLGINVGAAKLYAFTISAGLAGLGGVLLAFSNSSILLYQGYDSLASVTVVMQTVVGGIAHITGVIFGGTLVSGGLPGGLIANAVGGANGPEWLILIGAVLLLLTLLLNPDGIASSFKVTVASVTAKFERYRGFRPKVVRTRPAAGGGPSGQATEQAADQSAKHAASRPTIPALQHKEDSFLRLTGLSVSFGGVRALRGVDLELSSGEILGLIGPNGSGKTTLIDGVTGYVKAAGTVELGSVRADHLSPSKRVRAGITRSFQSLELFDDVTVEENLRAAADHQDRMGYVTALFPVRKPPMPEAVRAVVDEFELWPVLGKQPRELSYGQRRLVAIARAVATSPTFLLLDEPAAGLGSHETEELSHLVTRLARDWNIGVLLVEHDMNMVLGICDRVAVLEFGEKIAEGRPEEVRKNPLVIAAYLGKPPEEVSAAEAAVAMGQV
jgi:ABC-type branched-subunit amino acid transport system ATPase component/branched-subunit amino acid ABC-type transport system permease component